MDQWDLRRHLESLNESRAMDPTGLTTFMMLRGLADEIFQHTTFTALQLLTARDQVEADLRALRSLRDLVESPQAIVLVDDFAGRLRQAALDGGMTTPNLEKLDELLAAKYSLGFLRRDSLLSMSRLEHHQFTQGAPDPAELRRNVDVYEFLNANSAVRAALAQQNLRDQHGAHQGPRGRARQLLRLPRAQRRDHNHGDRPRGGSAPHVQPHEPPARPQPREAGLPALVPLPTHGLPPELRPTAGLPDLPRAVQHRGRAAQEDLRARARAVRLGRPDVRPHPRAVRPPEQAAAAAELHRRDGRRTARAARSPVRPGAEPALPTARHASPDPRGGARSPSRSPVGQTLHQLQRLDGGALRRAGPDPLPLRGGRAAEAAPAGTIGRPAAPGQARPLAQRESPPPGCRSRPCRP